MKGLHKVSFVLVIIGALNWGLVGLGWLAGGADWNVIHILVGSWGGVALEGIIYVLVGLAAVYLVSTHKRDCRYCNPGGMPM